MSQSLIPDAVPDWPREIGRRTFLSRARNLAVGGCTAAAILERPTLASTPTAPMPSPKGARPGEPYFFCIPAGKEV
jgi:hypothetical protein